MPPDWAFGIWFLITLLLRETLIKVKHALILFSLIFSAPAFACMGAVLEQAQEHDASVLFEGKPIAYEWNKSVSVPGLGSGPLAKVSFEVSKSIRGEQRKKWAAIMRGSSLPKSLSEFKKRFGDSMEVGLRSFSGVDQTKLPQGYAGLLFVVDAVCNTNGEDWLLRKVPKK
jgi:hypothetical protein